MILFRADSVHGFHSSPLPPICIPNRRCSPNERSSNVSTMYQTSRPTPSVPFAIITIQLFVRFEFCSLSSTLSGLPHLRARFSRLLLGRAGVANRAILSDGQPVGRYSHDGRFVTQPLSWRVMDGSSPCCCRSDSARLVHVVLLIRQRDVVKDM
jgi:hypothetical protein